MGTDSLDFTLSDPDNNSSGPYTAEVQGFGGPASEGIWEEDPYEPKRLARSVTTT